MKSRKLKKMKAFTLIEMIAVIIIVGIILIIAVPTITNIIRKAKLSYYESQENALLISGRDYYTTNRIKLSKVEGSKETVHLDMLVEEEYIVTIVDNNNVPCHDTESYVEVTKMEAGKNIYNVRLVCNNYDSLLAWSEWSEWLTTPPTDQQIEVEEDIFYNYQETGLFYSDWSIRQDIAYNNNLIQISEIAGTETEERTIYPYQDQEWLWYNRSNESICSADMPIGDG